MNNWDEAYLWQENANKNKNEEHPKWSWDCGFKLDYDGNLVNLLSRFYPPNSLNENWTGSMTIYLLGKEYLRKEFKNKDLDKLKQEVEKFSKHYIGILKSKLK